MSLVKSKQHRWRKLFSLQPFEKDYNYVYIIRKLWNTLIKFLIYTWITKLIAPKLIIGFKR